MSAPAFVYAIRAVGGGVVSLVLNDVLMTAFRVAPGSTPTLYVLPPNQIPTAETQEAFSLRYVPRPGLTLTAEIAWTSETAERWIQEADPDRPDYGHLRAVGMFTTHGTEGL